MKKRIFALLLSGLLAGTTAIHPQLVQAAGTQSTAADTYVIHTADEKSLDAITEQSNVNEVSHLTDQTLLEDQNMAVVQMSEATAEKLEAKHSVISVEKNVVFEAQDGGTETVDSGQPTVNQWNLDAVRWKKDLGEGSGVKVAVLDSGVNDNPDLDVQEDIRIDEKDQDVDAWYHDVSGHGTGVAGIIAAKQNGEGISGMAPEAEIYSIKVLDDEAQGTLSSVVAGIYAAIDHHCNIINMSFGTRTNSAILHQAIQEARDAGILLVASAGNQEGDLLYPAAYPEVMAVGSTDATGRWMADTANGDGLEVLAPGDQIEVTSDLCGTAVEAGTSYSAAQVTGAAAVLWAKDREKSADYIRQLLDAAGQHVENSPVKLLDLTNSVAHLGDFETSGSVSLPAGKAESYDTEGLVNGQFKGVDHEEIAGDAAKGHSISTNNLRLMKATAKMPDDNLYKSARLLHGARNYMLTLHFLYSCAGYLQAGNSIASSVAKAGADSGVQAAADQCKVDNNPYEDLMQKSDAMIRKDVLKGVSEKNADAKKFKALGLAMHLIGDTYAHRSIVPKSAVSGAASARTASKFGTADFKASGSHKVEDDATLILWAAKPSDKKIAPLICKRWNCFQATVNLQVMEFRDIEYYGIHHTKGVYEDNKKFCSTRFREADASAKRFVSSLLAGKSYDGIRILRPSVTWKLNNLKGYAKSAKEPGYAKYTEEDWKKCSTEKAV